MNSQEVIIQQFDLMNEVFQRKAFVRLKKDFIKLLEQSLLSANRQDYILHQLNNIHDIQNLVSFIDEINTLESQKLSHDLFIISEVSFELKKIRIIKNSDDQNHIKKIQDLIETNDFTHEHILISDKLNTQLILTLDLLVDQVRELSLYYHTDIADSQRLREFVNSLPLRIAQKLNITSSLAFVQEVDTLLGTESAALQIMKDSASQKKIINLDS